MYGVIVSNFLKVSLFVEKLSLVASDISIVLNNSSSISSKVTVAFVHYVGSYARNSNQSVPSGCIMCLSMLLLPYVAVAQLLSVM